MLHQHKFCYTSPPLCVGVWVTGGVRKARHRSQVHAANSVCAWLCVCVFVGEMICLRWVCMFIALPLLNRDFVFQFNSVVLFYVLHSVSSLSISLSLSLSLPPSALFPICVHLIQSFYLDLHFVTCLHFGLGFFISKCWHPELCF